MENVYDIIAWTINEDAETLDGASIVETSRRFEEWVEGHGRLGSVFTDTWVYCPRYTFFAHVDEESLESVVDHEKAKEEGGYFCKIVRGDIVLAREREREGIQDAEDDDEEEEEDEDDLLDLKKRVKIDELWYNIWVNEGIAQI
ncbi:hypothetical protein VTI74DRAFT_1234 [Chaetomium olivicolor]